MGNENQAVKLASGNIRTPEGRMSYPSLFKVNVQKNDDGSENRKFQVSIAFPKRADLSLLNAEVEKAAVDRWGADYKKKITLKKPFLRTEDYPKMGFDADEYPVFIRLSANEDRPPNVIRADKTNVGAAQEAGEVYAGRWAFASLNVYTTDHPKGGKRVSFGLQNVQLLRHDELIGSGPRVAADDEFEAVGDVAGEGASSDALFD
jgi:hypothetical protein